MKTELNHLLASFTGQGKNIAAVSALLVTFKILSKSFEFNDEAR